jgi:alpha-ketoglutarate-dependent taurine dioxygenase
MRNDLSKLMTAKAERVAGAAKVDISHLEGCPDYPLVISPRSSGLILTEWVRNNKEEFDERLLRHGAILLREFGVHTIDKFHAFMQTFGSPLLQYKQRSSPRFEVANNIYHSTTYPKDQAINMHSENSYARHWAKRIVFCCIQPARTQGETPIADNRLVVRYLSEATRQKFLNKGVRYVRNISREIGLSWQEVFQTADKKVVEEECNNNGMKMEWKGEDRLTLTWYNDAIYDHPITREQVWFNHAFFFHKYALSETVLSSFQPDELLAFNTFYGDGSEIRREEIEEIRGAYEQAKVVFPWQRGDVLFLDNMLMAHGRSPYTGDREIVVSML